MPPIKSSDRSPDSLNHTVAALHGTLYQLRVSFYLFDLYACGAYEYLAAGGGECQIYGLQSTSLSQTCTEEGTESFETLEQAFCTHSWQYDLEDDDLETMEPPLRSS